MTGPASFLAALLATMVAVALCFLLWLSGGS